MSETPEGKLQRIRQGGRIRVLDLFSGCGGVSVGFSLAGFTPLAGLDIDRSCMDSYWHNIHPEKGQAAMADMPSFDLAEVLPSDISGWLGIRDLCSEVDIIVGGPPCQAYSRIGRNKIAHLAGYEDAHLDDKRGYLWDDFTEWIELIRPIVILMENVPDSLNFGGRNIPELAARRLEGYGYRVSYTILNAVDYGVPQSRERVFLMAIHECVESEPVFPEPTHWLEPDPGARISRNRIHSLVEASVNTHGNSLHAVPPPISSRNKKPAVTCEAALSDLPFLTTLGPDSKGVRTRRIKDALLYPADPCNKFQEIMRTWTGMPFGNQVTGNVIRWTPRDFETFQNMHEGGNYLNAIAVAESLAAGDLCAFSAKHGRDPDPEEHAAIWKSRVPPYSRDKFDSKWTKLRRDKPSHTVVAHLSVDTYSHIHYDSSQARAISVREAARLQSFPDGYRFIANTSEAFKMIGNAVPPLLAYHLAKSIRSLLNQQGQGD